MQRISPFFKSTPIARTISFGMPSHIPCLSSPPTNINYAITKSPHIVAYQSTRGRFCNRSKNVVGCLYASAAFLRCFPFRHPKVQKLILPAVDAMFHCRHTERGAALTRQRHSFTSSSPSALFLGREEMIALIERGTDTEGEDEILGI